MSRRLKFPKRVDFSRVNRENLFLFRRDDLIPRNVLTALKLPIELLLFVVLNIQLIRSVDFKMRVRTN